MKCHDYGHLITIILSLHVYIGLEDASIQYSISNASYSTLTNFLLSVRLVNSLLFIL
jgi:hypothetical protein